ncbi:MAG: hypothetical protein JXQ99_03370 [Hyphomicrobiaceae bacterium]
MQQVQEATTGIARDRGAHGRMAPNNPGTRNPGTRNNAGAGNGAIRGSGNIDALRACLRELTAAYEAETRQLLNRIIAIEAEEKRRALSTTNGERSAS